MSSVNELASSFVEMAKAYERLPSLEQELNDTRQTISDQVDRIQRLELKLIDKNSEIADLHSTIRALEVSRDDAELRFLECDDAKSTLVRVLQGLIGDAQGVLTAIQPVPAVSAAPEAPQASPVIEPVVGDPTQDTSSYGGAPAETPPTEDRKTSIPSPAETHSLADTSQTEPSGTGAETTAIPSADALTPTDTPSNPVSVPAPFAPDVPSADGNSAASPNAETSENASLPTTIESSPTSTDIEPGKYIPTSAWGIDELNPAWIDWSNRQLATQ